MKTAKLLIMSLIILFSGVWSADAKKPKSTLDILTSTPAWEHNCSKHSGPVGDEIFLSFGKKTGRQIIYIKGLKFADATFSYYLSDSPVTIYDKKEEGKVKNGKYITMRYTGFDQSTIMYELLIKKGADPNEPSPPASFEIKSISPKELAIPSIGIDGVLVPCDNLKAAEAKLENIREDLARKEQSEKAKQKRNPAGKKQYRQQPFENQ